MADAQKPTFPKCAKTPQNRSKTPQKRFVVSRRVGVFFRFLSEIRDSLRAGVAAFDEHVAAAEENVQGLEYSADEVVGSGVGLDAVKFGLDEDGAGLVQGLSVVVLALLGGAARDKGPFLAKVKPGGAERLGHQEILSRSCERCCSAEQRYSQSNSMVRRVRCLKWKPNQKSS
jgi:hypothetical protein